MREREREDKGESERESERVRVRESKIKHFFNLCDTHISVTNSRDSDIFMRTAYL